MAKERSQGEKDILSFIQSVIPSSDLMTESILRNLVDLRSPKVENPNAMENGRPIKANKPEHALAMSHVVSWFEHEGQWNWPPNGIGKFVADTRAQELVNKRYPNGFDDVKYDDAGFIYDPSGEDPSPDATEFFVIIRPRRGRWSLCPCIYRCKEHGKIDMDVIPAEIQPLLQDAHIAFASR
jgi:hypothetical protein